MLWVARATTLHLVGAASTEGAEQDERRDRGLAELEHDRQPYPKRSARQVLGQRLRHE